MENQAHKKGNKGGQETKSRKQLVLSAYHNRLIGLFSFSTGTTL